MRTTDALATRDLDWKNLVQSTPVCSCLVRLLMLWIHGDEWFPYRQSKLTRLLQDSLGGSANSWRKDYLDTVATLKLALKSKKIVNSVIVHEDVASSRVSRVSNDDDEASLSVNDKPAAGYRRLLQPLTLISPVVCRQDQLEKITEEWREFSVSLSDEIA